MEVSNIEIAELEKTSADLAESAMAELSELQLALVGGGSGIVVVQ